MWGANQLGQKNTLELEPDILVDPSKFQKILVNLRNSYELLGIARKEPSEWP